jgi:hypothetical protein
MKGDFSRQTFDRRKHYNGVLMQQGRVQTDADWNEQGAIQRRRTQVEARDVIGPCGGPEDNAGFAIAIAGDQMRIGSGRYYVDGLLCENETADLLYEAQPDLLALPAWADALNKAKATAAIVYLDAWERHITALDDPQLREVALGGPDTATRIKTVWQVRILPVAPPDTVAKQKDLTKKREPLQKKVDDLTAAGGNPQDIASLRAELAKIDAQLAQLAGAVGCDTSFPEWDALVADPDRRLNARTQAPQDPTGPCVVPPTAGYRRLENQLYRAEVHKSGAIGAATFKWSRDNGSVVTSIESISGKNVVVHDLGPDDVLGFASGQWVEISDDRNELDGQPGQLLQIDTVNASLRRVTLTAAPTPLASGADGVDETRHPKLRRWDQGGDSATADGVAMTGAWLPLEDGVQVQFSGGPFRTGDYWLIPARTATGEIEWPPFAVPNIAPEPQLPRGIAHRFCRLALLTLSADGKQWSVAEDCRSLFPPITEPCCEAKSLHVAGTNWRNDDLFPLQVLSKDGLRVSLDAPPDPITLSNDSMLVAIEVPYVQNNSTPNNAVVQRVYVRGVVTRDATDSRVIVWRAQTPDPSSPAPAPAAPTAPAPSTGPVVTPPGTVVTQPGSVLTHPVLSILSDTVSLLQPQVAVAATAGTRSAKKTARARVTAAVSAPRATTTLAPRAETNLVRLRVTLKGHLIFNDIAQAGDVKPRYLDGQAFATRGVRSDNTTPRLALVFPSGRSAAASDFESWLFLGPEQLGTLQITTIRFLNANNQSSSAGDITMPLDPAKKVTFKAGEGIRTVEITFSRAVLQSSLGTGDARSVFVAIPAAAGVGRVPGELVLVSPTVVQFVAGSFFQAGSFVLNCLGTAAGGAPALAAADNSSALDGDLDNQPGGNFTMPFTSAG